MSSFYSIPGPAGTIQVGTVTKLAPAGTPTVTNVGTAQAAILNFGIPQGDAGLVSAANQGTAAAPGIAFAADTNTGFYNPSADVLGISTNGVGRLTIDATTQPAKELLDAVYFPIVTQADIGGGANQLSLNGMLGGMAFQNPEGVTVDRAVVAGPPGGATAESPLLTVTGAWFSGGTATTTKPELLIEPAGTTSTNWSTSGTGVGVNAASGFAGRLLDLQTNAANRFVVDADGDTSIGTATSKEARLLIGGTCGSSGNAARSIWASPTIPSTATSTYRGFHSIPQTQAASFTLGSLEHFRAQQGTIGANSAVTNQYGFFVDSSLTGATNNYGFFSNIASGTGRWNFYGAGTADSYFASNNFIWANGGSEKARIDSSGRLLVGTSTARTNYYSGLLSAIHQVEGANAGNNRTSSFTYGQSNASGPLLVLAKHRSDAIGGITSVASGDQLGSISFQGADGTNFLGAVSITGEVDGTPGANDMPGRLVFSTTADGASTPTERMRIDSSGRLLVGTTSASGNNLLQINSDALINGITIGRGASSIITNTALGLYALGAITTGLQNTAVGRATLTLNTTGNNNTGVGYLALTNSTTGSNNAAVGVSALLSNSTGENNTATGFQSLAYNTTGSYNSAHGIDALRNNTVGNYNSANGASSLLANTTGINNTAAGAGALQLNVTGSSNTSVGFQALSGSGKTVTAGNFVVGVSYTIQTVGTTDFTLIGAANNNVGTIFTATGVGTGTGTAASNTDFNTAVGSQALISTATGKNNAGIGYRSLYANTTGNFNTACGSTALFDNTTGSGNIGIGGTNSSGTYAPVFTTTTHSDRVVIGSTAVTNAYIQVAWTVVSDARDKTNFGSVPHGLDFVNQLKPCSFQFKEDRNTDVPNGPVRYGFKAQDILALEGDNPVVIDAEDPDKLRYNGEALVPVLVNAIQELTTVVSSLQAEVAALKGT